MTARDQPRQGFTHKLFALASDAAVYGASSALSQVIALALLPVYSRFLSPEDFGIVAMLTVLTTLFVPLANLGMTNAIFRRFNTCQDETERANVLSFGLISITIASLLLGAVGMVFAEPLSRLLTGSADFVRLVQWSLVTALLGSIGAAPQAVLRAQRRVKTMAVLNVIRILATVAATLVCLLGFGMRAEAVILGTFAGEAAGTLAMFAVTARSFRFRVSEPGVLRSMLDYGLPFVPHQVQSVGQVILGQYIVRTMLGLDEAGLYAVAAKLAVPLAFVVDAVQKAWVPYKFHIHAEDENPKDFFRTVTTYYFAGITYLWVGVSVWGPEVLRGLTDAQFDSAAPLVGLIAAIAYARGLRSMIATGIELGNNTRALPVASFLGLVTTAVACTALVAWLGPAGAALGSALAWVVIGLFLLRVCQRQYPIAYDWPALGSLVAVGVAMVAIGQAAQYWLGLWPRLALALLLSLAYPAIAVAILLRSPSERARMHATIARLRGMRRKPREPAPKAASSNAAEAAPPDEQPEKLINAEALE